MQPNTVFTLLVESRFHLTKCAKCNAYLFCLRNLKFPYSNPRYLAEKTFPPNIVDVIYNTFPVKHNKSHHEINCQIMFKMVSNHGLRC